MRRVTTLEVAETILAELLFMKGQRPGTKSNLRDIFVKKLIVASKDLFSADTLVMRMEPPIVLVGGIFAQFYDLLVLFETYGHPPAHKYLFLGDVVGGGQDNVETLMLLLCYKVLYPNSIFLLRGYNELDGVNAVNGFKKEIVKRYSEQIYQQCNQLFYTFPVAAVIASKIFCVNCGISPDISFITQIERSNIDKIDKNHPVYGFLSSTPDHGVESWTDEHDPRPAFGLAPLKKFMEQNGLDLLIRSRDIVEEGYEFPFDGDESLLTLSTAPSYQDRTEKPGSIVEIDNTLKMVFKPLRPLPYMHRDYYEKPKTRAKGGLPLPRARKPPKG